MSWTQLELQFLGEEEDRTLAWVKQVLYGKGLFKVKFKHKMELLYALGKCGNRELGMKILHDTDVMAWIKKNSNKVGNYNLKGKSK